MEINPADISQKSMYKLLSGSILPRPIAWVSTVDQAGEHNLAPFSFFNAVSSNPPYVLFCPNVRGTDGRQKDTYYNIQATGEFVVNIVTESTAAAMNLTAQELPADVDEFKLAGVTPVPSQAIQPPRVRESPINFECVLNQIVELGDGPGGGSVIIGRVVHLHVSDSVLMDGDKINLEALQPVGRLAGADYTRVTDRFALTRPPSKVK